MGWGGRDWIARTARARVRRVDWKKAEVSTGGAADWRAGSARGWGEVKARGQQHEQIRLPESRIKQIKIRAYLSA